MKKYSKISSYIVFASIAGIVAGCGNDDNQRYAQPQVIQQAPPVVIQQSDNSGAALTGAISGAALAMAMSRNNQPQASQQTIEKNTTIIHIQNPLVNLL